MSITLFGASSVDAAPFVGTVKVVMKSPLMTASLLTVFFVELFFMLLLSLLCRDDIGLLGVDKSTCPDWLVLREGYICACSCMHVQLFLVKERCISREAIEVW